MSNREHSHAVTPSLAPLDGADPTPRDRPSSNQRSRLLPAIAVASVILLALFALLVFSANLRVAYYQFGVSSPAIGFDLRLLAIFGALPFLFNAAFGAVFGLHFMGGATGCRGESHPSLLARLHRIYLPLVVFLAWCLLFNLPRFLAAKPFWHGLFAPWPPNVYAFPERLILALIFPMGNLGAIIGILIGICIGMWRGQSATPGEMRSM